MTAVLDQNKRNNFISSTIKQFTYLFSSVGSILEFFVGLISVVGLQMFLYGIETFCMAIWRLWTTILKIDAWLVMIHAWYFDAIFHKRVHQRRLQERNRKRPRREVRKLFPGLSRRKLMMISPAMHQVKDFEQNQYSSAIRTNRWTQTLSDRFPIPKAIEYISRFRLTIWDESQMWPMIQEITLIAISLFLMFVPRIARLLKLMAVQSVLRSQKSLRRLTTSTDDFWERILQILSRIPDPPPVKVWLRMRTLKKKRESTQLGDRRWSRTAYVYATVYNIDQKVSQLSKTQTYFDTDTAFVICDNASNIHVCNNKAEFQDLRPIENPSVVATIGGKNNCPSGIGTVTWSWKDDNGMTHTFTLKNVLYFPTSPVNVLSVTEFANSLNDDDGTGIDTKRRYSRFYWDKDQYQRTFHHSDSNLPEMPINEGTRSFSHFVKTCSTRINDSINKYCCLTDHRLDRMGDEAQAKKTPAQFLESVIQNDEPFIYKREGKNSMVRVISSRLDDQGVLKFKIRFPEGSEQEVTREFLNRPGNPEVCDLPQTTAEFRETATMLQDEDLKRIAQPQHLSPIQQEFLDMHHRLFHLPYAVMFRLANIGILPRYFLRLKKNPPPCISCLFGTAHRKPWRSKRAKDREQSTLRGATIDKPGQCVAIDQMVSAQPGLLPQEKGNLTRARVWGATVFVDYATNYTCIVLMRDLSAESTLAAKREFEHRCSTRGIKVQRYHADNGRFAEPAFVEDCKKLNQKLIFCGVGAHHQNGIVERKIKDITLSARTMLLHAMRHWPEYISIILWPFAVKCAEDRLNNLTINQDGITPEMSFSNSQATTVRLENYHPFGCPCYVLDSRVQSHSKGLPKWEPRARLAIFVGHSPAHSSSVALVLNPKTGLVSPQYHVAFDDTFSTIPHLRSGTVPKNWEQLVTNSSKLSTTENYDISRTWFEGKNDPSAEAANEGYLQEAGNKPDNPPSDPQSAESSANEHRPSSDAESHRPSSDEESHRPSSDEPSHRPSSDESSHRPSSDEPSHRPSSDEPSHRPSSDEETPENEGDQPFNPNSPSVSEGDEDLMMPKMVNLQKSGLRRSPRLNKSLLTILTAAFTTSLIFDTIDDAAVSMANSFERLNNTFEQIDKNFDGTFNSFITHVFAAGKEANEVYTFREMLKQDDRLQFVEAMQKEIDDHTRRKHWAVIPRSTMPKDMKTIMSIWSFKRKRLPDGTLNKHKARLCAHGGMQQWGVNYWETYAPVVNWISVRFLLIICQIVGLKSQALDFVLAFPQADLDTPVYMEIPVGISVDGIDQNRKYVLELKKSLYGLKQASSNWYACLKTALEVRGFKESQADSCVFIRNNMVILVYVDDCLLIGKDSDIIAEFVKSLTEGPENFEFTDEGSIDRYLGVDIQRLPNNEFVLRQPFLIQRIVTAMGLDADETNTRSNPVVGPLLSRDSDGPDRKFDWHYRSLIGMLGYLQNSTRPDISMGVHQCARFNASPKLCHEKAVKRIVRYLLGTADKGIHYSPDPNRGLECYVDADFAGGWSSGDHTNPECVLSRSGYVIMYAGCPITWSSKLQTEIALSTTEAEYIALSQAMREVIPFMNLMKEIDDVFGIHNPSPTFHCRVFEDNRSCIKVAESPKFTPRTKHIAIKYHHFRTHVEDGTVKIEHIDTKEQIADIFTKPLADSTFQYLRSKLMGW